MESDARLVEHEQGVDERCSEGGGEVDALDLAAAQGARLPIEGEVSEADLDEVAKPRAKLLQQEGRRLVGGGGGAELLDEREAPVEREGAEPVDVEGAGAGHRAGRRVRSGRLGHRARSAAGRRASRYFAALREPPVEGLRLQPGAAAALAPEVAAVAGEEDPDVHPVALALEPGEVAAHPEPAAVAPPAVTLDDPLALLRPEAAPRHVVRHSDPLRLLEQVALVGQVGLRLERLDRSFAQGQALVGDDEVVVDAHLAPESPAGVAGPDRGVEREEVGDRVAPGDAATRTFEGGGEPPHGVRTVPHRRLRPPASGRERRFERFDQPCPSVFSDAQAVLGDFELHRLRPVSRPASPPWSGGRRVARSRHRWRVGDGYRFVSRARLRSRFGLPPGLPRSRRLGRFCRLPVQPAGRSGPRDPRVPLPGKVLAHLLLGKPVRHPDPEADHRPLSGRLADEAVRDALRRVPAHLLSASAAKEPGVAGEEKLQVVVDLRHGAHRGARRSDLVGLVDGDGGRDPVDPVGAGPVHAIEELAGVGGEGLDVAALAFGVHRVECERGLPGAAHPGDDDELAEGQVHVKPLQVVLTGSADGDRALRRLRAPGGRGFHYPHYRAFHRLTTHAARLWLRNLPEGACFHEFTNEQPVWGLPHSVGCRVTPSANPTCQGANGPG